ncbi:MAG: lysozyme [Melioribacteraceae bacterium]|nr:lysozyme [Melioribacteraceae bacterium]
MKKVFLLILFFCAIATAQQKTTQVGVDIIKYFEGFRGKAYLCPASVLTIGFGSTGSHVKPGMVITEHEAELLLIQDLVRFEKYVNKTAQRLLRWHEFDALVSFSFNVGYRLKDELKFAVNTGNTKVVVYKLMLYNKAKVNGTYKILTGLTKRRTAESTVYSNPKVKIFSGFL